MTLLFKNAKIKKALPKEKEKGRPIAGKLIKRPHLILIRFYQKRPKRSSGWTK